MSEYLEKEVKVLSVTPSHVCQQLDLLGAKKVFDAERVFITLDSKDLKFKSEGKELRITLEDRTKLSFTMHLPDSQQETIKVFVSREKEITDLLERLGFTPIAKVRSHRISYEWLGIDFDIDEFPDIPPFLEIDLGESNLKMDEVITRLLIDDKEIVKMSTKDVYHRYGIDYYEKFKV